MNTNVKLYEDAGKPWRAVLEFSSPVTYRLGHTSKTGTRFEAYIGVTTLGLLGYHSNPNSRRCEIVPDGLVKVIPVDSHDFTRRLNKAIRFILTDRVHGRELDDAFENHDGDQMVAAIIRRARRNSQLDNLIRTRYTSDRCDWYQIAALRDGLTDDQLKAEADQTRKIESRLFFWDNKQAEQALNEYLKGVPS